MRWRLLRKFRERRYKSIISYKIEQNYLQEIYYILSQVTEEELKQLVVENLGLEFQLRAGVIFLSQLPRIPNGKIHRKLLYDWVQTYIYEDI